MTQDHEATAKKICEELVNISFASSRDRIDCYEIIEKAVAAALADAEGGAMDRSAVHYGEVIAKFRAKLAQAERENGELWAAHERDKVRVVQAEAERDELRAELERVKANWSYVTQQNLDYEEQIGDLRAKLAEAEADRINIEKVAGERWVKLKAKLAEAEQKLKSSEFHLTDNFIREGAYIKQLEAERDEAWQAVDAITDSLTKAIAERDAAFAIFRWLLGEEGDFPQRQEGEGAYYWRKELRERIAKAGKP